MDFLVSKSGNTVFGRYNPLYCHMNTVASASRLYSMAVRPSSLLLLLVSFIQKVFIQFGILCSAELSQSVLKTA